MIRLIAGISLDRAIGVYESKKGKLPWGLKEARGDLALFRQVTDNGIVIMGRKTWESIGSKPLTNRICFIVSSKETVSIAGSEIRATTVPNVKSAIAEAQEGWPERNIWIMGGTEIFREGMQFADEIFLTAVPLKAFKKFKPAQLVYFPEVDEERFKIRQCETHPINSRLRIIRYSTDEIRETIDDLRRAYQESAEKARSSKPKKQRRSKGGRKAASGDKSGKDSLVETMETTNDT
jgi:dihydrofolate reductase